jgi:hypothetical protein
VIVEPVSNYNWIRGALPTNELFDIINGNVAGQAPNVFDVLQSFATQKYTSPDEIKQDPAFVNMFLQFPNSIIRNLAMKIVSPRDSDDEKMEKIQAWVVKNIEYQEDSDQYGYEELWVPPVMLLSTMKGDCEDGAFLIMSLALNAGVDPNRLRFYGGYVDAGPGAASGGHGWVAYKRESDEKWVAVDFSYYPDLRAMDKRIPLRDDMKYVEQYFMLEVGRIITSDINRVREPNITYTNKGYIQPNVLLPGTWMSQYA